jgi:hypothetical protein
MVFAMVIGLSRTDRRRGAGSVSGQTATCGLRFLELFLVRT